MIYIKSGEIDFHRETKFNMRNVQFVKQNNMLPGVHDLSTVRSYQYIQINTIREGGGLVVVVVGGLSPL